MIKKIMVIAIFASSFLSASVQNVANISDLKEAIVLLLERQEQIDKKIAKNIEEQKDFMSSVASFVDSLELIGEKVAQLEEQLKNTESKGKFEELMKDSEKFSDELASEIQAMKDNIRALKDQMSLMSENVKEGESKNTTLDKKTAELLFTEIFNDKDTYNKFEELFNKMFEIKAKEKAFGVINQTVIRLDDDSTIDNAITKRTITKEELEKEEKQKQEKSKNNQKSIDEQKAEGAPILADYQFLLLQDMVEKVAENTTRRIYADIAKNKEKMDIKEDKNADVRVLPISKSKWGKGVIDEINSLKLEVSNLKESEPEKYQWLEYKINILEKALKRCCAKNTGVKEETIIFDYELK